MILKTLSKLSPLHLKLESDYEAIYFLTIESRESHEVDIPRINALGMVAKLNTEEIFHDKGKLDRANGQTGRNATPTSRRKMRILHLLFSSGMNGSERYCVDLANEQADLGHTVHVAGKAGSALERYLSPKVKFHSFSIPFLRGIQTRRLITRLSLDICHGHLSRGCKVLGSIRGIARIATLHVGYKRRQHAALDGLICINNAQLNRSASFKGKRRLIYNWVPALEEIAPWDLRAELNLSPTAKIIGAVGRLHPSKGFDLLINAFRSASLDDTTLMIIGEGKERETLTKLANGDGRIHLLGHRKNVAGFLRNLDLFVSSSREEPFGLAILEAMEAGVPVISTATEGPGEFLHSHPVSLIESQSVDVLAAELVKVLHEIPGGGRRRVNYDMTEFSRSTGVEKVLDFYHEVRAVREP
nr:glycosyltransferase [Rhizobium sp. CG4]